MDMGIRLTDIGIGLTSLLTAVILVRFLGNMFLIAFSSSMQWLMYQIS